VLGYVITGVIVLVVVALVVPILVLAHRIGNEAARNRRGAGEGRGQHGRARRAEHDDRARAGHHRRPQRGRARLGG